MGLCVPITIRVIVRLTAQVVRPPARMRRHRGTRTDKARQRHTINTTCSIGNSNISSISTAINQPQLPERDPGNVLPGTRPAVVEEDGPSGVERRSNQRRPRAPQLGRHGSQDAVGVLLLAVIEVRGLRGVETEHVQHVAGRAGEHAGRAGDGLREPVERGGIHNRPAPTGGGLGDGDAVRGANLRHGLIDELLHRGHGRGLIRQRGQLTAARGCALAGAQQNLGGGVRGPAVAQAPLAAHMLGDEGLLGAGRAEQLAHAILDGLAEDGAEGLVVERGLVDGGG